MNSIEIGVIAAMQTYGGNFIKRLADTYVAADPDNRERIKEAFSEYWDRYLAMRLSMETEDADGQD